MEKTVRAAASARRGRIDTVALAGSTVVAERQEGERREVGDGVRDAGGEVVGADVQLLQLPQLAEAARDGAGQRVVAEVQADKALELADLAWHRPRERVVAEARRSSDVRSPMPGGISPRTRPFWEMVSTWSDRRLASAGDITLDSAGWLGC